MAPGSSENNLAKARPDDWQRRAEAPKTSYASGETCFRQLDEHSQVLSSPSAFYRPKAASPFNYGAAGAEVTVY